MKKILYQSFRKVRDALLRWKRRMEDYLLNPESPSDADFKDEEPESREEAQKATAEMPETVKDVPETAEKAKETAEETQKAANTRMPVPGQRAEEPYATAILLPHGTPVGKPYKRQKEVRRMNVADFAEAYNLFIRLGDTAKATVRNKGGYYAYKTRDSKGGIRFELTAKPRRYPVHAIATLRITPDEGRSFPLKEIIFCVEPKNKKRK